MRQQEISRKDIECALSSVSFEFRGEMWTGDSNVQITSAHRNLRHKTASLSEDTLSLLFLFEPSVSAQILAQRKTLNIC